MINLKPGILIIEFSIFLLKNDIKIMLQRFIQSFVISIIRLYQAILSPFLGPHCRHIPSCSQYTIEAIQEWDVLTGGWLSIKRITRCRPWGTHGHDPVPVKGGK